MRALLDTHTFLWWNANDSQLSAIAREFISDGRNELFLSAASTWEIAIKAGKGRLTLPELPVQYIANRMRQYNFQPLPIMISHTTHVATLPNIHNDPFDRILIAQSQLEQMPLISADSAFGQYNTSIIW